MSPYDRKLQREYTLPAAVARVWNVWTTDEGVRNFFSQNSLIGTEPGDPYEIYFMMDAPPGLRGSERCKILRKEPLKCFTFSWNAPPHLDQVRNQQTVVELRFESLNEDSTRLTLIHTGWGEGEQWDQAYSYFENAWFNIVLPRLEKYLSDQDPWS
ncbi:SRPBCC family protein [Pelagicoccus mobilis]|uniref:SRPBCC domain-containing protein n=1 Tax=Pelagicoccus mobilis TaxID=415221 RepID=A0A934RYV8_9BACT|nr:SRPBCC domain-containing protein [Pelagicoccus mobilis]MBK1876369.1 SRPBCC domain-containing protein [Pelagicoccus mobilis]